MRVVLIRTFFLFLAFSNAISLFPINVINVGRSVFYVSPVFYCFLLYFYYFLYCVSQVPIVRQFVIFTIKITNYSTYYNMSKKMIRLTESDLHRIVKESVKRALMENTYNTHQYQVVAYLIDPNADWQRGELSSDSYEESKRDFELLSNLDGNLNRQAMNIFRKYKINNGAVEEHDSEEPFIMDIDGDGIYLLKRID